MFNVNSTRSGPVVDSDMTNVSLKYKKKNVFCSVSIQHNASQGHINVIWGHRHTVSLNIEITTGRMNVFSIKPHY